MQKRSSPVSMRVGRRVAQADLRRVHRRREELDALLQLRVLRARGATCDSSEELSVERIRGPFELHPTAKQRAQELGGSNRGIYLDTVDRDWLPLSLNCTVDDRRPMAVDLLGDPVRLLGRQRSRQ